MKLTYKILWVDDLIKDLISNGTKDDIQEHLEQLEFQVTIDCYETRELAEDKLNNATYDLILSDYNIGSEENNGDKLVEWIRSKKIFTEVLFYSAQQDFENALIGQDRISYFALYNDEGYKGFKEKVFELIGQTVRKFEELTPMRGFVMAETSILDSKVEELLTEYFSVENEDAAKMRETVLKKIRDSLLGNFRKPADFDLTPLTLKIGEKSSAEIVKERVFDASKKARCVGDLIAERGLSDKPDFQDFFENYNADVLAIRNKLAHARSDVVDDIECLIVDGDVPEKYDAERCKEIRKSLKKYSYCLDQLFAEDSEDEAGS